MARKEKLKKFLFGIPSARRTVLLVFAGILAGTTAKQYRDFLDEFGEYSTQADVQRQEKLLRQVEPLYEEAKRKDRAFREKEAEILKPIIQKIGLEPMIGNVGEDTGQFYYRDRKGNWRVGPGEQWAKERGTWDTDFARELEANPGIKAMRTELRKNNPDVYKKWNRWMNLSVKRRVELDSAKFSAKQRSEALKGTHRRATGYGLLVAGGAGFAARGMTDYLRRRRGQTRPANRPRGRRP
ncbi:MAG: hypothetical protein PHD95_06305 [Candidatus ainarchaeum sp.]|nr:hypothetical protein [Candidatus ainarchaeum sp.]